MGECSLRIVEEKDIELIKNWINNPKVHDFIRPRTPVTYEEVKKSYLSLPSEMKNIHFIIEDENKMPVGVVSLKNLHFVNKRAELHIFIGEDSARGKGYGKCGTLKILDFGFNKLNLFKIFLEVYEFNEKAVKLYEKIGFKIEGRLRFHSFKNGEYRHLLIMGILKDEYMKIHQNK